MLRVSSIFALLGCLAICPTASADEATDFFESKIRPVLIERCYKCHSQEGNAYKGGLTVDSREAIRRGGESGAAVVPEKLEESLLLDAIRYESYEMPPDGKLPDEVIHDFETWIRMGAPDPRDEKADPTQQRTKAEIDWEVARQHWAFQPPQPAELPEVPNAERCQTRIDYFVRSQLQENGIAPNNPADDRTILRRLYFDLVGLPPTAQQAAAFYAAAKENRTEAITQLVDELLASPHYGEKWTALWLDVMRYAEDQAHIVGNNKELFFPNAYLYRDWVIQSFNNDLPYDEFIRLQLAADSLTPEDTNDDVALGFIGLGPKYYRRNAPEVMADEYEDRVDVVCRGLLGLTVACARCHDHKFDPIPTEDYYALAGVFASTEMVNLPLNDEVEVAKGQAKNPEESRHVIRDRSPTDLNVMIRGDVNTKGELVPRRFLRALTEHDPQPFSHGSGRADLAECITTPTNPLTTRVIVNRVWGEYFGTPLVRTTSNFGALGERPTHPELLDDLAFHFMENGWSLKWLHREIVLSATYQQSSDIIAEKAKVDEANRLLWRMNRRRLKVEQWRDALLSVTGQLDAAVGGKSINPENVEEHRRTVYAERSRFQLNPLLARFDFPDPNAHAAGRVQTTTPLQKLLVMNSPFMNAQAKQLETRFAELEDNTARVDALYQSLFARMPSEQERQLALAYLENGNWHDYGHVLLASNEFVILD
ncbi:MAG: PSD1 and planctomycete cytochrome C domain-containing protein [Planctomycetaceae bacterium]